VKVFVSYAHRDSIKAEVGQLVQWLNEQEEVEAISDHSHSGRAPPQGWQAWMLHNIEDADMVLCVCGEAYKDGFEKRGGGMGTTWEGAIITVDLYENCGWNEKYYPILLKAGAHLFVPTPLKPWDNNIALTEWEGILRLIKDKQAGEAKKARSAFPSRFPVNNLPDKNPYFTGREQILDDIHRQFQSGRVVSLRQTVAGLGGVGKTQIAIEYAYRYAGDYDDIWWVNAESGPQEAYRAFVRKKGLLPKEESADWPMVLDAIKSWFDQHTRFLFIFDNVENVELLSGCLPRSSGHVLITTRKGHSPEGALVDVDKFNSGEAAAFLKNRLERDEGADAAELAGRLGYLPLALEQAAAYLKANKKPVRNYLKLLEKYGLQVFDERSASAYGYKETVNATWRISFDKIELESAKQLLNLCAYFAPDDIPFCMIIEGRNMLPKPLQAELADELSLNRVILELTQYSLVREKDGLLSLHRLLQEVVRDELRDNRQWLICCFNMACAVGYVNKWSMNAFKQNAPHVLAIAGHAEKALAGEEVQKKTSRLYYVFGLGFYDSGKYSEALECFQKALAIREKVLGEEHPDTVATYNNIALVYSCQENYAKAMEWLQKALAIREKIRGKEHPLTAATYNNIADVYSRQGDYAKGLELYQKALAIREKVLGKEHPDTITTYHGIARIYFYQEDDAKALEWRQKALAIHEKGLENEHPDTATAYNNIALVHLRQRDHAKAVEWLQKALDLFEKALGKEHPATAAAHNNIAVVYGGQGDYAKAMEGFREALDIFENVLGKEHPDTATAYHNIALVYSHQGDYAKALEGYQKALAILEKTLGKEHPDTIDTCNNIADVYSRQGDLAKAQEWRQKALATDEEDR
jgi:tetratricopeptide (TPR) repeat protein